MVTPNTSAIIAAADAKARLSEILDRVQRGEEITITRHGQPIARLVPNSPEQQQHAAAAAIDRWLAYRSTNQLTSGGLTWKDLRDEGRR